ncbi:VCBS domain-containing protein, partial [Roseinatronobacter bogoriensis]
TFALGTRTANFSLMAEGERWLYLDDGTGAEGATGTQIRTFNLDTLNYIGGDGNDLMIGLGGDEFFRGGLGNDVVVLNGGSNRIIGTLEELHGDRILDLTTRDVIVVEGIELADHNVAFDTAETRLIITPEGSEIAFHIDLYGEFIPEAFEVTVVGEISEIRYLGEIAPDPTLLPNLDLSAIQDGPVIEGRVFDIDTGFSVLSVNGMPVKEDSLHDGTLGTLQISDDGVFSYNPDMAVHLPEGERQDDLFTLVVSNSVGDTSELVIRASVTGVNDPASISGDSTGIVVEDDPERVQVAGVLTVTDPDAGEDRFRAPEPGALQGTFGTFAFDPETGAWTYTLDNDLDAVQALPEGGEVTDSLTVTSLDGTASETITVTIRGANDPASIAGESTGLVVEDDADRAQATGVLSVTDPDAGEDRFAEIDPAALAGDYGAFAFDPESGVWTYTLDNDLDAVQALPEGAEVTDSLSVTSLDGTASETITVTIRGTNDPASIAGDSTGLVVEDDVARQTTTGVLTVTDPDAGEDRFAEIDPAALAGDYGAFAFDPESGAWTYTLDNDADAVQALPEGAEVTDSLTVTSFDSTASETITVTILGADVATPEPNGTIMPQSAIQGRSGETLDGMTVTFTPDDGSTAIDIANTAEGFDLATAASASGRITASRDYIPETDGNVTALDALNVLRLAVGLSPSWGPASPMDFIAADINQDGQVTALDALEVLRAAVGLQSVNQPRWFFMDSEADLSHINRNDTLVEEGIRFDPAVTDISSLSMTGVLLGSMQEYAQ